MLLFFSIRVCFNMRAWPCVSRILAFSLPSVRVDGLKCLSLDALVLGFLDRQVAVWEISLKQSLSGHQEDILRHLTTFILF